MFNWKQLLNLIITFIVFWVGNKYFNEHINFVDTQAMIIATLIMVLGSIVFGLLVIFSATLMPVGIGCLTIIPSIIALILQIPIKLWLIDKYMTGVSLNGIWTYIILTAILMVFGVRAKVTRNQQNQQRG